MSSLTAIDVFAGCGGSSIGFRRAGFEVCAAVDVDPIACASYKKNLGFEPLIADVREVTGRQLLGRARLRRGQVTVLIGCPPCQGFTSHRRDARAGWDDRNRLLDEYVRLVEEIKPQFVVFENVPGLASGSGRWRLANALRRLDELGYALAYDVVEAADFGTPQRRARLLVVGSRVTSDVELPKPTHGDPTSEDVHKKHVLPWVTVRKAIGSLPRVRAGRVGDDPLHAARSHSEINLRRLRSVPHDGGSRDALPDDLVLECHRGHSGHYDVYGRMWWDRPAPTLTSGCTNMTRGRFAHPSQNRSITIREALLLQGFPRYTRVAGGIEQQSLQVGNAVPPPLAAAAARAIRAMLRSSGALTKTHRQTERRGSSNAA